MPDTYVKTVREIYVRWKESAALMISGHPDEEITVLLLENRLTDLQRAKMQAHIARCHACSQALVVSLKAQNFDDSEAPLKLVKRVQRLLRQE